MRIRVANARYGRDTGRKARGVSHTLSGCKIRHIWSPEDHRGTMTSSNMLPRVMTGHGVTYIQEGFVGGAEWCTWGVYLPTVLRTGCHLTMPDPSYVGHVHITCRCPHAIPSLSPHWFLLSITHNLILIHTLPSTRPCPIPALSLSADMS